jgi:hypothetical protein
MYRSSLLLLLPLVLVACSSGSDKGGADDSGSGRHSVGDFAPQEGTWAAGEPVYDDACGLGLGEDSEDEPTSVTLAMDADGGGFTLADEEDDEPMICTLDGQSFTCEVSGDDLGETDFADAGFDAVMMIDQTMGGDFSSETQAEFRMVIDVTCEGADCAEVSEMIGIDMPCTSLMSLPLTAG